MDAVASRRAALEDKRRRLEQIKARRNQRGTEQQQKSQTGNNDNSNSLDEYIDGLLAAPTPALAAADAPAAPADQPQEKESIDGVTKTTTTAKTSSMKAPQEEEAVVRMMQQAAIVAQTETFEMGTQTDLPWNDDDDTTTTNNNNELLHNDTNANKEETKEDSNEVEEGKDEQNQAVEELMTADYLSSEQREVYVQTPKFGQFLHVASKKVEKLLSDTPSIAEYLMNVDYTKERTSEEVKNDSEDGAGMISARAVYKCNEWTNGRNATCMDWSNTYKELILTGYHQPKSSSSASSLPSSTIDSTMSASAQLSTMVPSSASVHRGSIAAVTDGLALVWNLALTNRPEHVFTCWSPVVACKFHPTEPHLAIGGCHSGQIVLWDVRAGRLPVQKSALGITASSGAVRGHNYPISALEVTDGGSALVTSDTEGKLNFWSLSNLREPAESLALSNSNISALSVAADSSSILCGDDNGSLYSIMASSASATSTSARSNKRVQKRFETLDDTGHFSMMTAIATKSGACGGSNRSGQFAKGAAGLVLTCGVDWTTKVWAPAYSESPVLSFLSHSYDYMCDVQWSPTHPCVFATASSNGRLGLWNLASSLEEPLSGDGIRVRDEALNTLRWSGDGRRIAVASGDELHVLGLTEDVTKVKGEEETQMMENFSSRKLLEQ